MDLFWAYNDGYKDLYSTMLYNTPNWGYIQRNAVYTIVGQFLAK